MKNLITKLNFQNTKIFSVKIFLVLLWTVIFGGIQCREFTIESEPFFGYAIEEKYSMGLPFSINTRPTERAMDEYPKWFALKGIKLSEEDMRAMTAHKWHVKGIMGNFFIWIIVCFFIIRLVGKNRMAAGGNDESSDERPKK